MNNCYIIPTIGRESIHRAIKSIVAEDKSATIIIENRGNSAGQNRNMALRRVPNNIEWIMFLDDDDYLLPGFKSEIDNDYDIIVFTMNRKGKIIPVPKNK